MREIKLVPKWPKPIKYALVSDEDYEELNKYEWVYYKISGLTYAATIINSKAVYMHRMLMKCIPGDNLTVDHIDRNGLNNQRENLRIADVHQQAWNSIKHKDGLTSKYKGVYKNKRVGRWYSQIKYDGKRIHIGMFSTEVAAAKAYNKKAKELYGEFAKLNIIE